MTMGNCFGKRGTLKSSSLRPFDGSSPVHSQKPANPPEQLALNFPEIAPNTLKFRTPETVKPKPETLN